MTESNRKPGDLALTLVALPLIGVSAGFSYYVLSFDIPGGLASWSLTVLAYGLWLWPGRLLARKIRAPEDRP